MFDNHVTSVKYRFDLETHSNASLSHQIEIFLRNLNDLATQYSVVKERAESAEA